MVNALKFEKKNTEDFWALNDVSFSVNPGESIGIIGRNGAGKSTLLKILSKITPPTNGRIVSRGRIASLLEVGTGFHPELTGRENIYFNGSLLGMKRAEIDSKFDEIVDFSGVEKFLDTPLKHFSSGMQLRLAFAVAAFLEPEILIIDEVLAVGDAEFQKKCLGKMEDVSKSGRTILFVSHNLPSLRNICKRGILLKDGNLAYADEIGKVIKEYTTDHKDSTKIIEGIKYFEKTLKVNSIKIEDSELSKITIKQKSITISADITFQNKVPFEFTLHLKYKDNVVASYSDFVFAKQNKIYSPGRYNLNFEIDLPPLRSGDYIIDLYFEETFVKWLAVIEDFIELEIFETDHHTHLNSETLNWGPLLLKGKLNTTELDKNG
jgi:lipopolysaccharide transport system ATP-binding protein